MEPRLPKIGELVAGRYRILQELGHGGYGVVYRARQDAMGRDVAIKILRPEAAKDEVEVERFRREVFHASGLRHPNTITLYDFGETNGLFYIIMEYLQGMNLRDRLMKDGPLEADQALNVVTQILRALREAHEHGIVHRDLKPENVFLCDVVDGEQVVKVLDFGLSKYVPGSPEKEPTLTKRRRDLRYAAVHVSRTSVRPGDFAGDRYVCGGAADLRDVDHEHGVQWA